MLQMLWKGERAVLVVSLGFAVVCLVVGLPLFKIAPYINPNMSAVPLSEVLRLALGGLFGLLMLGTVLNVVGCTAIFLLRLTRQRD